MILWAMPFAFFWCGDEKTSAEGFLEDLRNHHSVRLQPCQGNAGKEMPAFLHHHFTAQIPLSSPAPQQLFYQCPCQLGAGDALCGSARKGH